MLPQSPLVRILVFVLAALLVLPVAAHAQSGDEDRPGRDRSGPSGDDEDEGNETDDDDRSGRGPGSQEERGDRIDDDGDDDGDEDGEDEDGEDGEDGRGRGRGHDEGDDPRSRAIRQSVSQQVGQFQLTDGSVDGRFVSFLLEDGDVAHYAYRGTIVFDLIDFEPALQPDEVRSSGAQFRAEGDDAEFKAVDTPSGHFKAETDHGTLTFHLASGFTATPGNDSSGHGNSKITIRGGNLTAFVDGDDLRIENGTIVADEEARFNVHAPGLRGNLSPKISEAAEDGRLGAEVLVTKDGDRPDDAVPIAYGPYNLTVETGGRSVRLTIEGHGDGTALLFDLERDALGRAEDLVIHFDGERIDMADDIEDVLNTTADEPAEYILIVGHNKTQVLVSVPHFSVHTIELSSAGPVQIIEAITGSAVALAAAAMVAVGFVAVTWTLRNRQR